MRSLVLPMSMIQADGSLTNPKLAWADGPWEGFLPPAPLTCASVVCMCVVPTLAHSTPVNLSCHQLLLSQNCMGQGQWNASSYSAIHCNESDHCHEVDQFVTSSMHRWGTLWHFAHSSHVESQVFVLSIMNKYICAQLKTFTSQCIKHDHKMVVFSTQISSGNVSLNGYNKQKMADSMM
jgi:hypothetical protein